MWIGDQFAKNKAEQVRLLDIVSIFSPTPETTLLERPTNHFILGAKGSGKSTLLRALTWPVWQRRPKGSPPQYLGIYLPIRYEDASYFRTAYDELHTTALFEHFFVASLLYNAAVQLEEALIDHKAVLSVLSEYLHQRERKNVTTLSQLALKFSKERNLCVSAAKHTPNSGPSDIASLLERRLDITDIQYLSEQITITLGGGSDGPGRFGVLIDSIDFYGPLASVLAPLFESDASNPLVVKAAARSLDVSDMMSRTQSRSLEMQRDFEVVSLDREPDNEDHLKLLRDAICKRARHKAPSEIDQLTDSEILDLLFYTSRSDPEDLASFDSFCRLSSGNVLQLILLLDEAATTHRNSLVRPPAPLDPLSRESRLKTIEQEARKFWDLELGVRLPSYRLEAKVFCEALVELAKSRNAGEQLLAPSFRFGQLSEDEQSLVSALLSTRVLIAHDAIVHKTLQAGFSYTGPLTLELNRLMLPAVGMRPVSGQTVDVNIRDFYKTFSKVLKETKPYLSPKATHSRGELFAPDFTVFLSVPFDKGKRKRTRVLRKAINALYKEATGKAGEEGLSFVDIHYIPHVGAFRFDIPKWINEATYVVADISEIGIDQTRTAGVFYEIGVAIGLKKPLALFYNSKNPTFGVPAFNAEALPHLLAGQTVVIVDEKSTNFSQEYRRIHEQLLAHNGYLDHPLGISKAPEILAKEPYAYLSFQPRNSDALEWCIRSLQQIVPEVQIVKARNWQADDAPTFVQTISNAAFSIVDCTESVNNYCIELGVAAAIDWRRVLEAFDSNAERRLNPVAMFHGKRLAWTDFGENDTRQLVELIKHLARTTKLGTRRL